MTFIRGFMSRFRVIQSVTLILTILFYILGMMTTPLSAGAIGKYEDLQKDKDGKPVEVDLKAYTFDEICSMEVVFPANVETLKTGNEVQRGLYFNFKTAQEYYKWRETAFKTISHTGSLDGDLQFQPEPSAENEKGISNKDSSGQFTAEAWALYNSTSNKLTRIMARGQGHEMVDGVFGNEFDPTNAVTIAAMNTFTMVCNAIFNTVAKALMMLFLVQTGFDVMYLTLPFTQGILAPSNANSGGGNAGVASGKKFALRFNLVSNEAVDANNRSSTGSVGSNGATGGGFLQTNIFMRYIIARAPLIMLAFTYFVLVATNVWPSIISACTSLITGIFYGL